MIHTALQLFKTLYRYGNRLTGAAPGRAARAASCGRSNFAIPLPLAGCLGRLFGAAGPSCFGPGKSPGVAGFEEGVEVGMRHVDGLAPLLAAHDPKAQPARQPLPALPAAAIIRAQPSPNLWQYLRQTYLSIRVFEVYNAIVEAACPSLDQAHQSARARPIHRHSKLALSVSHNGRWYNCLRTVTTGTSRKRYRSPHCGRNRGKTW